VTVSRLLMGLSCGLVGVVVVLVAPRLALIPQWADRYYERHPSAALRTMRLRKKLASQSGVSGLTTFWRICGIVWIVSGVALMASVR
jgi:hypothetical protein